MINRISSTEEANNIIPYLHVGISAQETFLISSPQKLMSIKLIISWILFDRFYTDLR